MKARVATPQEAGLTTPRRLPACPTQGAGKMRVGRYERRRTVATHRGGVAIMSKSGALRARRRPGACPT
jgi:hypothetical protein